jgi:catechol 2,3-dioxygenase-like lactoylglutathione lyase family enzyme
MKYICPLLIVEDVNHSRSLYEATLGLKVIKDYGENLTFEGDFALHQRDHFETLIGNKPVRSGLHNFELYFEALDIEAVYEKVQKARLILVHPLREQPWRQRCFRFFDYDNHTIEVGEPMEFLAYRLHKEGMILEEIARTISMSPEEVEEAIINFGQ